MRKVSENSDNFDNEISEILGEIPLPIEADYLEDLIIIARDSYNSGEHYECEIYYENLHEYYEDELEGLVTK